MNDDYSPREMRLMAERDTALSRAERLERENSELKRHCDALRHQLLSLSAELGKLVESRELQRVATAESFDLLRMRRHE